mgnify:CR=1 FL=1
MPCSHCGHCHCHDKPAPAFASVAEALEQKRPWVLGALARACGISAMEAAMALPTEMRVFAPAESFEQVWRGIVQWPHASLVCQQAGFGFKYSGSIPLGTLKGSIYHFSGTAGLNGHVRLDALGKICFLTLPFMGHETCSIQFFDAHGDSMLAVHVGKTGSGLCPFSRDMFYAMRTKALKSEHDGAGQELSQAV